MGDDSMFWERSSLLKSIAMKRTGFILLLKKLQLPKEALLPMFTKRKTKCSTFLREKWKSRAGIRHSERQRGPWQFFQEIFHTGSVILEPAKAKSWSRSRQVDSNTFL